MSRYSPCWRWPGVRTPSRRQSSAWAGAPCCGRPAQTISKRNLIGVTLPVWWLGTAETYEPIATARVKARTVLVRSLDSASVLSLVRLVEVRAPVLTRPPPEAGLRSARRSWRMRSILIKSLRTRRSRSATVRRRTDMTEPALLALRLASLDASRSCPRSFIMLSKSLEDEVLRQGSRGQQPLPARVSGASTLRQPHGDQGVRMLLGRLSLLG